eukprot:scaffold113966_cov63-Phaeocystis_antarctica.AAC.7
MPKPVVFKDIGKSCTGAQTLPPPLARWIPEQSPHLCTHADLLTKDWAGGSNILGKSEVKLESKTPNGIVRAAPPPGTARGLTSTGAAGGVLTQQAGGGRLSAALRARPSAGVHP